MIEQLTVFIPSQPGRLAALGRVLGEKGIQIYALMVADATDFAIVRIICDKPRLAEDTLTYMGYQAATSQVIAVEVPNVPGGMASVLDRLNSADLNVSYAYCCSIANKTIDIIRVTGDPVEVKLRQIGFRSLEPADIGISE